MAYLDILKQAKSEFWKQHSNLSEQARQNLWHHEISLANNDFDLNLAAQPTLAPQVPRSMSAASSFDTPDMAAQYLNQAVNSMDRTLSAPPAVSMGRSPSSHGYGENPIRRSSSNTTNTWPVNDQTSAYALFSDGTSGRLQPSLQPINENVASANHCVEYEPSEYITSYLQHSSPSYSFPSNSESTRLQVAQLTNPSQWSPSTLDGSISPSSPPALMTPVTVSDGSMSRQSSFNSHMFDDAPMFRVHSDSLPILSEDGHQFPLFAVDSNYSTSCAATSVSVPFTVSGESFPSARVSSNVSAFASSRQQLDLAEDMRRSASSSSESNEGYASSSSSCSRYSQREREIKAHASHCKIAPKAIEIDETKSASSNIQMKQVSSESKNVAAITKQTSIYTRPHHPKIHCHFCKKRPEGFRGTHELERHIARKHTKTRKAYICFDSSSDKKFLANCKHCRNKKVYGADYNAAAHLRRTHFHPRPRGRKTKTAEKRGGIGGGDDPPMDTLRQFWIREIEVENTEYDNNPNDLSDEEQDETTSSNDTDASRYESVPASFSQAPIDLSNVNMMDTNSYVDANPFMTPNGVPYGSYMQCGAFNDASIATADMFEFDAYVN